MLNAVLPTAVGPTIDMRCFWFMAVRFMNFTDAGYALGIATASFF